LRQIGLNALSEAILRKKEAFAYLANENLRNSHYNTRAAKVASTRRVDCFTICVRVISGPSLAMERAVPRFITFTNLPAEGLNRRKYKVKAKTYETKIPYVDCGRGRTLHKRFRIG